MAPFTRGHCPHCAAETRQRFLPGDAKDELPLICETCFTVIAHGLDGSIACRDATHDERAMVPPPVVFSEEQRAEWRASLQQSRGEIRGWLDAGCPGLTPELERVFPAGWLDRVRKFTEGGAEQ